MPTSTSATVPRDHQVAARDLPSRPSPRTSRTSRRTGGSWSRSRSTRRQSKPRAFGDLLCAVARGVVGGFRALFHVCDSTGSSHPRSSSASRPTRRASRAAAPRAARLRGDNLMGRQAALSLMRLDKVQGMSAAKAPPSIACSTSTRSSARARCRRSSTTERRHPDAAARRRVGFMFNLASRRKTPRFSARLRGRCCGFRAFSQRLIVGRSATRQRRETAADRVPAARHDGRGARRRRRRRAGLSASKAAGCRLIRSLHSGVVWGFPAFRRGRTNRMRAAA